MASVAPSLSPVLVTGGCGFIGHHLVHHLLETDPSCDIHVMDINVSRNRFASVTYHQCDISSSEAVDQVLQQTQPRTIFHIACPDSMVVLPQLFEKVNVDGTRNILSSAAKLGTVKALVFTSTSSVINDNVTDMTNADETLPILRPPVQKRVYTLTKATAEEEIIAANRKKGDSSMLTVSIRPSLTIGEADTICLGKMIPRAEEGKMKYQIGKGTNIYDFVYVGNLVDAHILAAQALVSAYGKPPPQAHRRVDGENFNITNDEHILFWDFSRKVAAATGHPVRKEDIVVVPAWLALFMAWCSEWIAWLRGTRPKLTVEAIRLTTLHRTLSVEKAKSLLGYQPKISIDEGIERGVKWYMDHQQKSG